MDTNIPEGYCQCGCGQRVGRWPYTDRRQGRVKGHYKRYKVGHSGGIAGPLTERLWSKVAVGEGCWIWTGSKTTSGYGQIWDGARLVLAHRAAWQLRFGAIPDGMFVLHKCDTPACVRPDHLFLGTGKDNMQDCVQKGRLLSPRRLQAQPRGSNHGQSKLTEEDVLEARRLFREEGLTMAELGQRFGVSPQAIRSAINKGWRHVPDA